ncbi:hypothetical protein [Streptomyces sp. LUP47B]|uniref:hypothetical protein n=1 Tax=Streptomyces sp. LUP47B TaxID=1890286 RepID=UPI00085164E0|nr:hypothetical protein [Streptomyces sp. LUP47B]
MPRAKNTVQPYPPGTKWTFSNRESRYTQTVELVLLAEPSGAGIADDYSPDEISAADLWRLWADGNANSDHRKWPDLFRPGEVQIYWTVTLPEITGIYEWAPHTLTTPPDPQLVKLFGDVPPENFLTHFTHPVNEETGERLNWLRLPVVDRGWNATVANSGGFIQEATGWKPSALQPTMDVVQIGAAAGLYVPDIH